MPETLTMRFSLEDVSLSAITNTGVWLQELAAAVPGWPACSLPPRKSRRHGGMRLPGGRSPGWKRPILRCRTGNCSATRCAGAAPVLRVIAGQLIGFFRSLQEGLHPDSPSVNGAINRVVEGFRIHRRSPQDKS